MTMSDCIEDCTRCHRICVETMIHCLAQGEPLAERDHMRALWDCADACRLAADLMSRGSPLHQTACGLCRDACQSYLASCTDLPADAQVGRTADACRRCAASCDQMSRM